MENQAKVNVLQDDNRSIKTDSKLQIHLRIEPSKIRVGHKPQYSKPSIDSTKIEDIFNTFRMCPDRTEADLHPMEPKSKPGTDSGWHPRADSMHSRMMVEPEGKIIFYHNGK